MGLHYFTGQREVLVFFIFLSSSKFLIDAEQICGTKTLPVHKSLSLFPPFPSVKSSIHYLGTPDLRSREESNVTYQMKIRGGEVNKNNDADTIKNENDALDTLVDELIEEVDSSDGENEGEVNQKIPIRMKNGDEESIKTASKNENQASAKSLKLMKASSRNVSKENQKTKSKGNSGNYSKSKSTKSRKVKHLNESLIKSQPKENLSTKLNRKTSSCDKELQSIKHPTDSASKKIPTPPPNRLFRFLLTKGVLGHIFIMISVTIYELFSKFVPPLVHSIKFILIQMRLYNPNAPSQLMSSSSRSSKVSSTSSFNVNAQYSAFVDLSKSTRKNRQAQRKQMDLMAYEKLKLLGKQVGSINQVKLRHCSVSFQRRHNLGIFQSGRESKEMNSYKETYPSDESAADSAQIKQLGKKKKKKGLLAEILEGEAIEKHIEDVDIESDSEWVMQAFENNPNLSVLIANAESSPKKKKRNSSYSGEGCNPDNVISAESGGNALIKSLQKTISGSGTRILGAYPNDAVPVEEAGSADGVITLARKYGYGNWEWDNDFIEDEDSFLSDEDYHKSDESDFDGSWENKTKRDKVRRKRSPYGTNDGVKETNTSIQKNYQSFLQFDYSLSSGSRSEIKTSKVGTKSTHTRNRTRTKSTKPVVDKDSFNPIDMMSGIKSEEEKKIRRKAAKSAFNDTNKNIRKIVASKAKDSPKYLSKNSKASSFIQKEKEELSGTTVKYPLSSSLSQRKSSLRGESRNFRKKIPRPNLPLQRTFEVKKNADEKAE